MIFDEEQRPIASVSSEFSGRALSFKTKENRNFFNVKLSLSKVQFSAGKYSLTFILSDNTLPLLRIKDVESFQVISEAVIWQPFELEGIWN